MSWIPGAGVFLLKDETQFILYEVPIDQAPSNYNDGCIIFNIINVNLF